MEARRRRFFPPQQIQVGSRNFLFQDGGLTSFNNPALLLFLMATLPEYGLGWPPGESGRRRLRGHRCGSSGAPGPQPAAGRLLFNASNLPAVFMRGASVGQDMVCRSLARARAGEIIDREFGSRLNGLGPAGRNLFTYVRYDANLSDEAMAAFGSMSARDRKRLRKLDAVGAIPQLQAVGRAVAEQINYDRDFGELASRVSPKERCPTRHRAAPEQVGRPLFCAANTHSRSATKRLASRVTARPMSVTGALKLRGSSQLSMVVVVRGMRGCRMRRAGSGVGNDQSL